MSREPVRSWVRLAAPITKLTIAPAAAFLGVGLAAVGIFDDVPSLTLGGTIASALAVLAMSIWQAASIEKIERQGETITAQAIRIERLITGGEGYAYCSIITNLNQISVINPGDAPLYDLAIRIYDITGSAYDPSPDSNEKFWRHNHSVGVGDIPASSAKMIPLPLQHPQNAQRFDLNLFFSGRNGHWTQEHRAALVDGRWIIADRVMGFGKHLYEAIQPDFPRGADGQVNW